MILGIDHEHDGINLGLACKDGHGLGQVTIQTGRVNQRYINDPIGEETPSTGSIILAEYTPELELVHR
jgi:hypothetical protein